MRTKRLFTLMLIYAILIFLLIGRLWYIQVVMGEHYKSVAQGNRIKLLRLKATRGLIYDISGAPLAVNLPSFGLSLIPASLGDDDSLKRFIKGLSDEIGVPYREIWRNYRRRVRSRYWPVLLVDNLTLPQIVDIRDWLSSHSFLSVEAGSRRFYPWGDLFSHVLGYTAEISERELKLYGDMGYRGGDQIGKMGLEKVYEEYLRGIDGYEEVEVDALGREVSILDRLPPRRGYDLILNIDRHLQKVAYDALGNNRGCVILMNPEDGAVLALVSKPSFDPNRFVWGIDPYEWRSIMKNPLHPMLNRATQAELPPGSLFKVITAMTALSEGVTSARRRILCTGSIKIGNRVFKCWKEGGHGWVDIYQAIAHSCNIYFYTVGRELGIKKLSRYAEACGFGRKTGIDLASEARGFVPTPSWKKKRLKEPWYPGDTVNLSIGQGYLLVTPIQMACLVSAIANGGTIFKPRIARALRDSNGNLIKRFGPMVSMKLPFSESIIDQVRRGMRLAVREGTARVLSTMRIKVAGKTGSAQNPSGKEHAWFMGFAPYNDPSVAIVVMVEEGGAGGAVAAPIAKKVLKFYFRRYGNGGGKV
ncbi:MAG: penicillin-binding protein 2 [Synergistetes bacterium]|nr:penicillin-binding protein 2 [Synergistota bacterium]